MWALEKPSLDDANQDLDKAFPHGNIPQVDNDRDEIKRIYKLYEDNNGKKDNEYKGSRCNKITTTKIKNAYAKTYDGNDLAYIRSELFLDIDKCPICSISLPTELDHVLPQSEFNLLAINRQNLVPNCHSCNNSKLAKNPDDFVHSYFAKFPNDYFFTANLTVINESIFVDFTLAKDPFHAIGEMDLYRRAKNQIKEVKLSLRLRKEVNGFLFDAFEPNSFNDKTFKNYLANLVTKYTNLYGKNDWRTALLLAMSLNNLVTVDLINKIVSRYQPRIKRV